MPPRSLTSFAAGVLERYREMIPLEIWPNPTVRQLEGTFQRPIRELRYIAWSGTVWIMDAWLADLSLRLICIAFGISGSCAPRLGAQKKRRPKAALVK
jgi:hypothetical protein